MFIGTYEKGGFDARPKMQLLTVSRIELKVIYQALGEFLSEGSDEDKSTAESIRKVIESYHNTFKSK